MTTTTRRLLPNVLRVAAVLSALAIASYLVVRAQRNAEVPAEPPPTESTDSTPKPTTSGLSTSKSLVIEPVNPTPSPVLPSTFGLYSSKSGRVPSPEPKPTEKQ